jgi:hypothetical protein
MKLNLRGALASNSRGVFKILLDPARSEEYPLESSCLPLPKEPNIFLSSMKDAGREYIEEKNECPYYIGQSKQ